MSRRQAVMGGVSRRLAGLGEESEISRAGG